MLELWDRETSETIALFQVKPAIAKRDLLGCFLAQDLPHVRTGSSVFEHLKKLVPDFETGRFTKEEDALIIQEVEKNGDNLQTWKNLAKVLKRGFHFKIKARFNLHLKNPDIIKPFRSFIT